ncbi:MAG: HAD family phosphatase [Bacteroidales bacterium]|nr:HAD family phosphatase [Bacteroidales bacterium]MDD4669938.1 HAD family phosphatase [Bacteroidales bacterium]
MTLRNIIFDFGGVLIDWNPRHLYKGYFKSDEQMEYFLNNICTNQWNGETDRGRPFRESISILQAQYPEYRDAIQLYMDGWTTMIKGAISPTVEILKALKAKEYHLYGLTNWSAETFPYAYNRFEFLHILEGIVVSGEEKLLKPDPAIYNRLIERYHLKPEESLFIDDNNVNVEAAAALGMKGIHFTGAEELLNQLSLLKVL